MASLRDLNFDNSYARLPAAFHEVVDPTPLDDPRLVAFSPEAAQLIDLDPAAALDPDAAALLSGATRLPGAEPVAMIYAGHQFGVWVPQLGDGRAILLGEVKNSRGERWDLHLKGAGPTRFSRRGDGRSVLRSAVREYLASEAMAGLGIPTTRALALVASDTTVYRETPERAATLIRLAPTHVRFGTFQLFASRGETARVEELAEYVIAHHFPELAGRPDRFRELITAVTLTTADLMAQWLAVGFTHGVMNTDNMSILGLTLDYGPYGFVDDYQPAFVPNHTDHEGRYALGAQPAVGMWNVARFAEALLSLVPLEEAKAAVDLYPGRFEATIGELLRKKLGLVTSEPDDAALIDDWLALLEAAGGDYTRSFRALAELETRGDAIPPALQLLGDRDRLAGWLERYRGRLAREGSGDDRRLRMNRVNPKYVLRTYLAQQAIALAEDRNYEEIERLRQVLRDPFAEQPEFEKYADPPPPWSKELVVSCSS